MDEGRRRDHAIAQRRPQQPLWANERSYHGNFDEAGLTIFRDLSERYGAVPWRVDRDALQYAISRLGLVAAPTTVQSLDELVTRLPCAIPEELLLDELLADLREAAARAS